MLTLNEAWSLLRPYEAERHKVALAGRGGQGRVCLPFWRLSLPLVWRRLPILPVWLGRPRSELHAQKRMCQSCLGAWAPGYKGGQVLATPPLLGQVKWIRPR